MIVVEGVDNSGKSTVAEAIAKAVGFKVEHSVRPKGYVGPYDLYAHCYQQLEPRAKVLDRIYPISEYVYGNVIRNKTQSGVYHKKIIADTLSRDLLIIWCNPPLKVIMDDDREQMAGVNDHKPRLRAQYHRLMNEFIFYGSGKVVEYDWTRPRQLSEVLEESIQHAKKVKNIIQSSGHIFLESHHVK